MVPPSPSCEMPLDLFGSDPHRALGHEATGFYRVVVVPRQLRPPQLRQLVQRVVMRCKGFGSDRQAWKQAADYIREVRRAEPFKASQQEKAAPISPPWQRPVAATFDYIDEHGEILFETVKFADGQNPRFMQRRSNGTWNINGVQRVLYRLPEVIKAVTDGHAIFVVEGEKDADSLRSLGIIATTNPMGAGKWRPEFNEHLRGADAVIVGDHDDAGRKHVEQVAQALHGIAKRVRVLDLSGVWPGCPDKGDISDWIEAGGNAEKLTELVEALPDWKGASVASVALVAAATWPAIDGAAYHGLPGEVVRIIAPHSEADPVALLIQILALAGNIIGPNPYYQVESDRHRANLFCALVGDSSKARKGTSLGRVRAIAAVADESWGSDRLKSGLSSGEGLINEVRDERKEWNRKEGREEIIDPGVKDKRLMVVEPEFAGALAVTERHGNTLSSIIRRAWDGDRLSTLTKNSPLCCHPSLAGAADAFRSDETARVLHASRRRGGVAVRGTRAAGGDAGGRVSSVGLARGA
jgi:hypothetical protein